MGLDSRKNVESKISESDVKIGSAARLDIHMILDAIDRHEDFIAAGELDIDTIQGLTALYQKGIEYYSAFDNVMFTDLLYRMQSLLQREDINMILNSMQESTSPGKQEPTNEVIGSANPLPQQTNEEPATEKREEDHQPVANFTQETVQESAVTNDTKEEPVADQPVGAFVIDDGASDESDDDKPLLGSSEKPKPKVEEKSEQPVAAASPDKEKAVSTDPAEAPTGAFAIGDDGSDESY